MPLTASTPAISAFGVCRRKRMLRVMRRGFPAANRVVRRATKCALIISFLISTNAFGEERWTSPDKFYSITPPPDWSQRDSASGPHRSFAWVSPDRKAEIRISATYGLVRLPHELPNEIVDAFFPRQRGLTPVNKVLGDGWDGLRREYTNADESTRSLALSARRGSTIVAITMTAPASDFDRFRPFFESAALSLTLGD